MSVTSTFRATDNYMHTRMCMCARTCVRILNAHQKICELVQWMICYISLAAKNGLTPQSGWHFSDGLMTGKV
jgi:hypothetical protein